MKVICIDADVYLASGPPGFPNLHVGKEYTVVNEDIIEGVKYYELAEFVRPDQEYYYEADCFIPLSSIDEKEFERNHNKQLA